MKTSQNQQAKELYFSTGKTQKEIAQAVGVTEKTIHRWIKDDAWDRLKKATLNAPVVIVENLYSQIAELQDRIAAREVGDRCPTIQEAEVTRKLINCIEKLGHTQSLGAHIQVMTGFTNYMRYADLEFTKKLVVYADAYMNERKGVFKPYQWAADFPFANADPSVIQDIKDGLELQDCYPPQDHPEENVDSEAYRDIATGAGVQQMSVPDVDAPMDISIGVSSQIVDNECFVANIQPQVPPGPMEVSGHFGGRIRKQDIPALSSGVKWLGKGRVYDPALQKERNIRLGEADEYTRLGLGYRCLYDTMPL